MDKAVPIEKIWEKFDNKYKALVIMSMEARRLFYRLAEQGIEKKEHIYYQAIINVLKGLTEWEEG